MTSWTRGVTSCHRRSRRFATLSPLFTGSRKPSPSSHRPRTYVASCHASNDSHRRKSRTILFLLSRRWLTPYGHFEAQHYPWRWESKTEGDRRAIYRRDDGARTSATASRTRDEFLTRSNFDRYLLEQIHDRSEGSRIRSSRAMDGARASSSAMSLDAAGELSRTDKRTPTYSHPCYLSPVRSRRGATHPAPRTHADSPSRVPTPVLRASSIIFVQARELQLGDGGEHVTGVTEWPGGSLKKRKMRFLLTCTRRSTRRRCPNEWYKLYVKQHNFILYLKNEK